MKLCKNCKHLHINFFDKILLGLEFAKCRSTTNQNYSLVSGNRIQKFDYCVIGRSADNLCGSEAKWFEERG